VSLEALYPPLSPEHTLFRETVSTFVCDRVVPLTRQINFDRVISAAERDLMWDALRGHGVIDDVPRTEEGMIDWIALGLLLEGLATADASIALLWNAEELMRALIHSVLSEEQKREHAALFTRESHWAGGFSEPGAGSDTTHMATTARRTAQGWIINGRKIWITAADKSNVIVLSCAVEGESTGLFVIDRRQSPYDARPIEMLGMRGAGSCEVLFDQVPVPANARIDIDRAGRSKLNRMLRVFSFNPAALGLGMAQHALELALAYARERQQFGRAIAGFQLVQEMLANMATQITTGRLLLYRFLGLLQTQAAQHEINLVGSMTKWYCTEMAQQVTSLGVQIQGAMGLALESGAQRLLRDARMFTIAGGTSQIQTLLIGRELTGISALR
jgi:alkylation response protein AidB-like acyl-CoA dehydrogenase